MLRILAVAGPMNARLANEFLIEIDGVDTQYFTNVLRHIVTQVCADALAHVWVSVFVCVRVCASVCVAGQQVAII